jgi:hypothetical protein
MVLFKPSEVLLEPPRTVRAVLRPIYLVVAFVSIVLRVGSGKARIDILRDWDMLLPHPLLAA